MLGPIERAKGSDNWSPLPRDWDRAFRTKSLEGSGPRRYRGHAICLYGPKVGVGLASQCRRNDDTTRTTTTTKTDPTREWGTPVLLTRRNRATRVCPLTRRPTSGRDSASWVTVPLDKLLKEGGKLAGSTFFSRWSRKIRVLLCDLNFRI